MKKTQFIELCHLIRHSLVPFLSIVLFVTMSVTLYAGLTWTGSALRAHVDQALDESSAYDFAITSQLGLTDSDVGQLALVSGVSDAEGGYLSYQAISGDDGDRYCMTRSIPERIGTLEVVEGTLPTSDDEIALLNNCTDWCEYRVGDTITFETDGGDADTDGMKYLKKRTYTITALVKSPDYLCKSQVSLGSNADGRQLTCVFYLAKDAFSSDAFHGAYPCAYVTGMKLHTANSFNKGYDALASDLQDAIEQAGVTLAQGRYAALQNEADTKIADGESQLEDAKAQIDSGQAQITDGEQQLSEKKAELADAQAQLAEAIALLNDKKLEAQAQFAGAEERIASAQVQRDQLQRQYDEGESQLTYYTNMEASLRELSAHITSNFKNLSDEVTAHYTEPDFLTWVAERAAEINADTAAQVADFKATYPTRPAELDELLDGLTLDVNNLEASQKAAENAEGLAVAADKVQTDAVEPGQKKLAEGKDALDQLNSGIADAQALLAEKRAEYYQETSAAQQKIDDGKSQIASGESQIADAESQLADGKSQLADAEARYADGQQQLDDAKAQASQLKPADWIVTTRNDAYVSQVVDTTTTTLNSLRMTMASLFILVGLLVCYSVMARLVHEHLILIGTKKALGFTLSEISRLFLGYALLTCVLGIVLGSVFGASVVQLVLMPQINQYTLSDPPIFFRFSDVVGVGAVEIVLISFSAWVACWSVLRRNAVDLLAGERPHQVRRRFYESWPVWNRLSLLTQTMINNCFYDKRRVFGTLVGVTGCTALIVCAMTLQGGIDTTLAEQQNVIERYDQVVYVSSDDVGADTVGAMDATVGATVDGLIASKGYASATALYQTMTLDLPTKLKTGATLIVPQSAGDLESLMTIRMTEGSASLDGDGVYVSRALADSCSYAVGDELSFIQADGSRLKVPIAGIFDYYGGSHVALMSEGAYRTYFGKAPDYSARLVATGDDASAFASQVKTASDYSCLIDSRETTREVSESVSGLAVRVVIVYTIVSALVALFVLLNLNVMYITEKKRELVVMMINGYEVRDAKRYVSSDSHIINAIGMIVGCVLGTLLGLLAIRSLNNNMLVFIPQISPLAWLIGVAICSLFAFIVLHIALRRVDAFKLTSMNE